jgi:hypothetical protein
MTIAVEWTLLLLLLLPSCYLRMLPHHRLHLRTHQNRHHP